MEPAVTAAQALERDDQAVAGVRRNFAGRVHEDLRAAYLADERPWVVGFSGGKDSTALLQFVYYMLGRLPASERRKRVHVLASDTRVETPSISQRIRQELAKIEAAGARDGLPISTCLVYPKLNDTFWVNLIGRGYPSPTTRFRWCTDRLKILPATAFIRSMVDGNGSVLVVLGARKAESSTRAQAMNARAIEGQRFHPHPELQRAWVYTPIEDLSTQEVWVYLLQVPSPWGGDNRALVTLYRRAGGGECPLVIDTSTPSCGQSRFGCWTCTVVERDRSMEAMVQSGEDNLWPLLELRDFLKAARDMPGARYDLRRNGTKPVNRHTGEEMVNTGPFTHSVRRDILRRVLEAQKRSGISLIGGDEMAAIQEIWCREEGIPQPTDAVLRVWNHVHGGSPMAPDDDPLDENVLSTEDRLLLEVCRQHRVPFEMMRRLRDTEDKFGHLKRRHGLPEEMRDIVRQSVRQEEA